MERHFLGWDRPLPVSAVEWFLAQQSDTATATADFSDWIAVFPTARAGRRFLELLAHRLQARRRAFLPPFVVTVGGLPELLYQNRRPFASPTVQSLAWVAALEELRRRSPESVARILRRPPAADDLHERLQAGEWFARLHAELSGAGLTFEDVAREAPQRIADFPEGPRWEALAELQRCYLEILDANGYWDVQTARLHAVRNGECRATRRIVLVGIVDPPRIVRAMLDAAGDQAAALVAAPREEADRFDPWGTLIPEAWRALPQPPDPDRISVVDQAVEQAAKVEEALRQWSLDHASGEITIGLADESLAPLLLQILERLEVPARYGPGVPVTESLPWRLLSGLSAYASSGTAEDLVALLRHPWVESYLRRTGVEHDDILSAADQWMQRHLPLDAAAGMETTGEFSASMKRAYARLTEAVGPLLHAGPMPPQYWADGIAQALAEFFDAARDTFGQAGPDAANDSPSPIRDEQAWREACDHIAAGLHAWLDVPDSLWKRAGLCLTGKDWLPLLERELRGCRLPPKPLPDAVELVGWLEIPWDDARAVIVTNMNEGLTPSTTGNDPFLPNRLREAFELNDNARRFARDAYGLTLLIQGRAEWRLIAARQTLDGDPLLPSRLLFSREKEVFLRQVERYFDRPETAPGRLLPSVPPVAADSREDPWAPPPPEPLPPPAEMRVTEFRDYLACPYRYYLRHRLRLESCSDDVEELSAMDFGTLAHQVLSEFGRSKQKDSDDPNETADYLAARLDRLVKSRFGAGPKPAVAVQVEHLKQRLAAFARRQAERARQGWRIETCEYSLSGALGPLDEPGLAVSVVGRVDRIDYHPEQNAFEILDYKLGDAGTGPEEAHRKRLRDPTRPPHLPESLWEKLVHRGESVTRWVDLQLPLYEYLVRDFLTRKAPEPSGRRDAPTIRLGYFLLPKDVGKTGTEFVNWSRAELDHAVEAAREVIRCVCRGRFGPPADPPPPGFDDLNRIIGKTR
ncbi:PD-(D/E)XK nuclease family protein [Thermopirellula anaerolimosa]